MFKAIIVTSCLMTIWVVGRAEQSNNQLAVREQHDKNNSKQTISVQFKRTPLKHALALVARKVGVSLSYKTAILPDKLVNYRASQTSVWEVLKNILEDTGLYATASSDHKTILIKQQLQEVKGQQQTITGVVRDASSGETLPGVNISVKGTTTGTSSNADGKYSLNVESLQDTLIFSFIGYETKVVPINSRTKINVQLNTETVQGEDVVVVGYSTQKKVTVTGSISSVNTAEILKAPTANLGNALVGKVSGLQSIQRSGAPGSTAPDLFIRGIGSLAEGRSKPLIIVDGVKRKTFGQLDPNNVASISILKDASATAVYGIEGANGVIIVTTKRGKKGPAKISVTLSSGFQQPTTPLKFADSYTYAKRYNEAQLNDGVKEGKLRFSPKVLKAFKTHSDPIIYPDTDWLDYVMKPVAYQTRNNINISGGTDNIRYYVAGGYLKQDGMFRNFDNAANNNYSFNRYNFRTNLDIDVTPSTQISLTGSGRIGVRKHPIAKDGLNQLFRLLYWATPMSSPGIIDGKYVKTNSVYIPGTKKDGLDPFYGRGYTQSTRSVLNLDLSATQKLDFLTDGLRFKLRVSSNSSYAQNKNRSSSKARYYPFYKTDVDPSAQGDSTIVYQKAGSNGILNYGEGYGKDRSWYIDARFDYQRDFGPHQIKALALYNERKNYYPAQFTGIPRGLVGMAGRLNYNYANRYLVELNMGYNGSENFAKGKRFGFFPAISGGWNITNEKFMRGVKFLDHLKLRASYGIVGNDQGVGRFLYLPDSYFPSTGGYNFGNDVPQNQTGASEGQIGNPNVGWETSKKQNYGLDTRLFNDQLSISVDYFREHRDNILTTKNTVPAYVAANLPAVNIGKVDNHGFEVELKWRQNLGDFSYHINGNVSYAKNKIVYTDEVDHNEPYLYRTGHSVGTPFGYAFAGFYTAADTAAGSGLPDQKFNAKPGDLRYKDLNGDNVIDTDDQHPIGYPEYPEYTLGANLGFRFKGFDVTTIWAGAAHASRLLSNSTYRNAFGPPNNRGLLQVYADNRWTPENAENATFPRLSFQADANNYKDSDFWIRDASYLRLKNVEIGYTVQPKILSQLGVKKLRAYINGYNLLTFSHLKIGDPEQQKASRSDYPIVKVYNIGLKITF